MAKEGTQIGVYMSEDEKKKFEEVANREGKKLSVFMREAAQIVGNLDPYALKLAKDFQETTNLNLGSVISRLLIRDAVFHTHFIQGRSLKSNHLIPLEIIAPSSKISGEEVGEEMLKALESLYPTKAIKQIGKD